MQNQTYSLKIHRHAQQQHSRVAVFLIVKNEAYILPHFFQHYRALGIREFIVYDDKSLDGTRAFLMRQPDCTLLGSDRDFGEVIARYPDGTPKRFGPMLKEVLPPRFSGDGWSLIVDADEFLVLPCGFAQIDALVDELEARRQFYLAAPMVDFYPATLKERNFDRSISPFSGAPYFDHGPLFDWAGRVVPRQVPRGIRTRLMQMLLEADRQAMLDIYGKHPISAAKSWKVPLIKHNQGIRHIGDHEINVAPELDLMGTLAHFKFAPNLDDKIAGAIASGAYNNGSMEYKFLHEVITRFDETSLLHPTASRRYTGVESLEAAGLSSSGRRPATDAPPPDVQAQNYWNERKDNIYLYATRQICRHFSPRPRSVIDIGSNGTPILEWFRDSADTLYSLDLRKPYQSDGVESITADLLEFPVHRKFALATCLQVIEHVPDAGRFARKLLQLADTLIVSVPFRWLPGFCEEHLHDPVDEEKLLEWFERPPDYRYLATELNGIRRLIAVYRTTASHSKNSL